MAHIRKSYGYQENLDLMLNMCSFLSQFIHAHTCRISHGELMYRLFNFIK